MKLVIKKQKAEGRKQKGRIILTLLLFCGLTVFSYGQTSTGEQPYSWENGRGEVNISSTPIITMPNLDFKTLQREDEENEGLDIPYRFGFMHEVNLSLTNSGLWQTTSDGGRLWTLRIYSPDALSLNLLYDQFWLPEGAKFFLYSEDIKEYLGAFTSQNNKGDKENIKGFATSFLFTKSIVLEYYEPADIHETGIISISKIVSGYRNIYDSKLRDIPGNDDYSCLVDVNCYSYWVEKEKNAVALMIMGNGACSGALLNTTANDNRPVFLTANHCFHSEVGFDQYVFYWNFEANKECDTVVLLTYPDPIKSTSGASLLAKREDSDFMLLSLEDDNPALNTNITVYYLGWERTGTSFPHGFCIHHPVKLSKMITITLDPIINYPYKMCWDEDCIGGISPPNTHWYINIYRGIVFYGSSGSPLMNDNKRVIGQLHGGNLPMCPPENGYINHALFGRFDVSWTGRTSSTRLSDWLDPLETGATFTDGLSFCRQFLTNVTITNNTDIVGCNIHTMQDVSISRNPIVNITAASEVIINSEFHAAGGTEVSISIKNSKENSPQSPPIVNNGIILEDNNLQKKATDGAEIRNNSFGFILLPNPNPGTFQIETNFPLTEVAHLKITNTLGITVYETRHLVSNEIQLQNTCTGLYFVVMILKNGSVLTQKMMVLK
jgi:hypothetical protein